jgi:hypothetical protein
MTLVYSLLLAATLQATPQQLLGEVQAHYQSLNSFSTRIEQQINSISFPTTPGRTTQTLRWRRGGRFELLHTGEDLRPYGSFYSDGRYVLQIAPDLVWSAEELAVPEDKTTLWEVNALPILGWLQNTPTSPWYFEIQPPDWLRYEWSFGPRTEWQGLPVRELRMSIRGTSSYDRSLFVDPEKKLFIGWESGSSFGLFVDQQLNPALPDTLGDSPAEESEP